MEKVIEIDCLPDIVNETGKETNIPYLRSGECTKCAGYCFFIHNIYDTSKLGFCLSFLVTKNISLFLLKRILSYLKILERKEKWEKRKQ